MTILLDLRNRLSHAGIPLVHPKSEHVVLANVFGTLKNFSAESAIYPWLKLITTDEIVRDRDWRFSFWERQEKPIGVVGEGSTEVDLILESGSSLVFVEVKMDAGPSPGTKADPNRNQLLRNLDIGYRRAQKSGKAFALVYVTPDMSEPDVVARLRKSKELFAANPEVEQGRISACMFWSSWGLIGDVIAGSYNTEKLDGSERKFALDLLAYLCAKRLWENTLKDDRRFYENKLFKSLRRNDSPFIPYGHDKPERYEGWRIKPWKEADLRRYLQTLPPKDQALLKLLSEGDGSLLQHVIMDQLPFLKGRTSASLRSVKAHVNGGCRQLDCAQILSEGSGSGDFRIHEINHQLGDLRQVVIDIAKQFEIPWHLLQRKY